MDTLSAILAVSTAVYANSPTLSTLEIFTACRAFARDEPAVCRELAGFPAGLDDRGKDRASSRRPEDYGFLCLSHTHDLAMARAAITRDPAAFAAACRGREAIGYGRFGKPVASKACGLMGELVEDPETACAALAPYFARGAAARFCAAELRMFLGDPVRCEALAGEPAARELCEGAAAFRKAWLRRDAGRCRGHPICRVLMGAGEAACGSPSPRHEARAAQAAAALAQLEGLAARLEGGGEKACRDAFSVGVLLRDFREARLPESLEEMLFQRVGSDLERHSLCRAYTASDPSVCDELAPIDIPFRRERGVEPVSQDLLCKTLFYEARIAQAIAEDSPEVAGLCVKRNEAGDRDFKLETLARSCAIVAGHSGDTAATCSRLAPYFDNASIAKTCPNMLRFVSGDAGVCPALKDPMVNERCLGYVAFHQARRARNPALCGDSAYCVTLFGSDPASCRPHEARIARSYCGLLSRRGLAGRFPALLDALDGTLSAAGPAGETLRPRARALRERLARGGAASGARPFGGE